jgi:hypothetical protein
VINQITIYLKSTKISHWDRLYLAVPSGGK